MFSLKKAEIIRGYKSFNRIFENSKYFISGLLKANLNIESKPAEIYKEEFKKNPLLKSNIKVGFVVSKRKFRKAAERNRIKRLMRESYRLNKFILNKDLNVNIIFGVNEKYLISKDELNLDLFKMNMIKLLNGINKHIRD